MSEKHTGACEKLVCLDEWLESRCAVPSCILLHQSGWCRGMCTQLLIGKEGAPGGGTKQSDMLMSYLEGRSLQRETEVNRTAAAAAAAAEVCVYQSTAGPPAGQTWT